MKKQVLILLSIVCLSMLQTSCKSEAIIPKIETFKTVKDSIVTNFIKADSLHVLRQADSVKLKALISELNETALVKKSKYATASIKRIGNEIQVDCKCDEYKKAIVVYKEVIQHYKTILEQQSETIVIPKKFIPKIIKYLAWIGGTFLLFIAALIAIKLFKPKIPLL